MQFDRYEARHCPCCGHELEPANFVVDLNSNTVSFGGERWLIEPQMAIFLDVLAKAWPAMATDLDILIALYGDSVGEMRHTLIMKCYASNARKLFRDSPIDVARVRPRGYALILPPVAKVRAHG